MTPEHVFEIFLFKKINKQFSSEGSFAIIYVYSAELYPTTLRSVGVGACSVFARLGGMCAPHAVTAVAAAAGGSPVAPVAAFGAAALAAGAAVAAALPETAGQKLPDTVREVEEKRMRSSEEVVVVDGEGQNMI